MGIVYIMRGIPGSGKTTYAKELAGTSGKIHSTDNYFVENGHYVFDQRKLGEYHQKNLEAFKESLKAGAPIVVCDNTNIKVCHMQPYIEAAEVYGYRIEVITMPHLDPQVAARRNVHNVPLPAITRMAQIFEPYP